VRRFKAGNRMCCSRAREHDRPWNEITYALGRCGRAPGAVRWAREHHSPWNELTCA